MSDDVRGTRPLSRRTLLRAGVLGLVGVGAGALVAGLDEREVAPRARGPATSDGRLATGVPADVAHRWVGHHLAIVADNGIPAPAAAEVFALLGIVLGAVARPGAVRGSPPDAGGGALAALELPDVPHRRADPALTADAALSWLVTRRYVDSTGPALVSAVTEAERVVEQAPAALRGPARDAGQAIGRAVLDWYLRVMVPTGTAAVQPTSTRGPGSWEPTPPDYEQPVLPDWGNKPTLVLPEVESPPDPPEFSTEPGSPRHRLAIEVRDTVAALTGDQWAIAQHWADGKWTITPPGHWLRITSRALQERDADLDLAADTLFLLGLAQHDAFVSCWAAKYRTDVLRPLTYIRRHLDAPGWESPVTTPCFPEYTSGHATQSAAAATVLAAVLGDVPFTDVLDGERPARSYPSFTAAAEEAAASRLYGGIHFRDSNDEGLACGRRIGAAVARRHGSA